MSRAQQLPRAHANLVSGAVDDGMAYAVLPWAYSLDRSAHTPPHFIIGFLEGKLNSRNRQALTAGLSSLSISHDFVELTPDPRFIKQGHISPTTFSKFQLADTIPGPHVWIDIDTVATAGWDQIFSEISQAPRSTALVVAERGHEHTVSTETSRKPSDLAFNAGVLGWPDRERIPWSEALDSAAAVDTQEQYLFNALYSGRFHRVSERFNALSYHYDTVDQMSLPLIAHFAGAHKPWHLPRRFAQLCTRYHCPWGLWFEVEQELLGKLAGSADLRDIRRLRREGLRSGRWSSARDHRGRMLLHVLRMLGPFGWALVVVSQPLKKLVPRGTHPLH